MFEIAIRGGFAAAHRIREYGGTCERLHGHNYQVEVRAAAPAVDRLGLVLDFRDLKRRLHEVLDAFDHQYLNELAEFRERNPTAEQIAQTLFEALTGQFPDGVTLTAVTVWESPDASATYRPDE